MDKGALAGWVEIPGVGGRYELSLSGGGRVRSLWSRHGPRREPLYLTPLKREGERLPAFTMTIGGARRIVRLDRLVEAVIEGRPPRIGLRLGEEHPRAVLCGEEVEVARELFEEGHSPREIADLLDAPYNAVWGACAWATWRHPEKDPPKEKAPVTH